ncbi:flavin-binding monooxygenase-like protein [Rhexocercosporidium sp. MPI-PUGE-AT-0058]|nr:flavin-binding monooxygenase-like protein [Rhexocercosporidium sp. MPI-PUGE-AT-0058]
MTRLPNLSHLCRRHDRILRQATRSRIRQSTTPLLVSQTRTACQSPLHLSPARIISISQTRPFQHQALPARDSSPLAEKIVNINASTSSPTYKIQEQPLGKLRPLRVIIFGAGVNGLNMLYTLRKEASGVDCVIIEKNPECGGTWYENRYPGCASDDPSHHYQYTHTLSPSWSSVFAQAGEIKQYLNDFIDNNSLRSSIHCNSSVTSSQWDEEKQKWIIGVKNEAAGTISEEEADVIIDATGIFNDYKWPELKGLQSFKGRLIHTANWPSDFDYHGKNVAVLGNGASGVQIVPALQPHVNKLIHCIRSKTWIAPPSKAVRYCHQHTIGTTNIFSEEWTKTLASDPEKYKIFLEEIDNMAREERFKTILTSTSNAHTSLSEITAYMAAQLASHPHLMASLIPTFPIGCRRITSSPSYLSSLCSPNVVVETSPIETITPNGILLASNSNLNSNSISSADPNLNPNPNSNSNPNSISDSETFHEVDAIICATGFNTSFLPRFPIIGDGGLNLQDAWSEAMGGPRAYMSMMAEGMPNYFRILGPNGPLAHGAVPRLSTHMCTYVLSHIAKMRVENYSSIRVQPGAVREFNEHIQAFMPRTAWAGGGCGGWYRSKMSTTGEGEGNGEGGMGKKVGNKGVGEERVTALHPGSQTHWEMMLEDVRWEDFVYGRVGAGMQGNRFAYLGNGFAVGEVGEDEVGNGGDVNKGSDPSLSSQATPQL